MEEVRGGFDVESKMDPIKYIDFNMKGGKVERGQEQGVGYFINNSCLLIPQSYNHKYKTDTIFYICTKKCKTIYLRNKTWTISNLRTQGVF